MSARPARRALRPEPAPPWTAHVVASGHSARAWAESLRAEPERAAGLRALCRYPGETGNEVGVRQAAAVAEACARNHLNALPFGAAVRVEELTVAVVEPGGRLYLAEVIVGSHIPLSLLAPPGRMAFVDP